jgi:LPXTG-motif cell wall-anchored protein
MVPASAAEDDAAFAEARFLTGSVVGEDLDDVVSLHGASSAHRGDGAPVADTNPLGLDVLRQTLLDIDGGIQVEPLRDLAELGLVNQYATSGPSGQAGAGTGLVADNGAIGTGKEAGYPETATIHLTDLLGSNVTDSVADVDLVVEAVSAIAQVDPRAGLNTTDYEIAGMYLEISVPLLVDLLADLGSGLGGGEECVLGEGAVQIDACDGRVTVNLYAWTDGTLNGMEPNTEILSAEVLDELIARVDNDLSALLADLLGSVGLDGATDGVAGQLSDVTEEITPAIEQLNDLLSIRVNVQGDERYVNPQFFGGPRPAVETSCEEAGVTALQVEVAGGDVAVLSLGAADAAGCVTTDEGGDEDGGDEDGGDEDGGDAAGGPGGDVGGAGDRLPDTGTGSGWLLGAGVALMLIGGTTVYAMSRRPTSR